MKHGITYLCIILFLSILFSCEGKTIYHYYLDKAESLLQEYPDSALKYLDSIPSPELLSKKQFHQYYLLRVQGKNKNRQDISKDTILLDICGYYDESDPEKASIIYLYSGKILQQQHRYKDALLKYLEAEKSCNKLDRKRSGVIQHAIGNLLFLLRHNEEAKERLFNALSDFHESQDVINEVTVLNLIGNCYIVENKIDSAYSYYESCIELLDQLGKHQYTSILLSNIALGYSVAGEMSKSHLYLEKALNKADKNIDKARINYNLANLNKDNEEKFYHYINSAIYLVRDEVAPLFKSSLYFALFEYEDKKENIPLALDYHKNMSLIKKNFLIINMSHL